MARNLTQLQDDAYVGLDLIDVAQPVTQKQFEQLSRKYRKLRLELTSTGELIVMPPTGSETGRLNFNLTSQLAAWFSQLGAGVCFNSNAGFTLPNGAIRSPDVAWIKSERWDSLTEQQKKKFAPICPDFVVELRSPSDNLTPLYLKMFEYIENGTYLGWLIDPVKRQVYVYRPDHEVVTLNNPETVSADPLLPGFTLNLTELW
ncbi:MAG TPA: Uma2 family endonuclease [Pyrinomonadaceae bacterium]|nr:Uma2 family endonuclease [Pyrinomonadaceae bacterium]HYV10677.1 Uma2 family endonuclease [Pyrinomonadaceae bacterium]